MFCLEMLARLETLVQKCNHRELANWRANGKASESNVGEHSHLLRLARSKQSVCAPQGCSGCGSITRTQHTQTHTTHTQTHTQYLTVSVAVVGMCDTTETFLSSCVPDLERRTNIIIIIIIITIIILLTIITPKTIFETILIIFIIKLIVVNFCCFNQVCSLNIPSPNLNTKS